MKEFGRFYEPPSDRGSGEKKKKKGYQKQSATNPRQISNTQEGVSNEPLPGSRRAKRRRRRITDNTVNRLVNYGVLSYPRAKLIVERKLSE